MILYTFQSLYPQFFLKISATFSFVTLTFLVNYYYICFFCISITDDTLLDDDDVEVDASDPFFADAFADGNFAGKKNSKSAGKTGIKCITIIIQS